MNAPARPCRWLLVAGLLALVTGCSSVVSGDPNVSPDASSSASTSGAGSASATASSPSPDARFPRTPTSTAIGDPVTADLCALVPLSSFADLGYSPAYANSVLPPGCVVNMRKAGQVTFSVYVYGVGSNSFSHLTPLSPAQSKPNRTSTISGIKVAAYAYLPNAGGACIRNVLAQGLTLSVFSYTTKGRPDRRANCDAANTMTRLMAKVAATGSVPRLQLADPSVTDLDFCGVLRATKVSDLSAYDGATLSRDGVGDGCHLTRSTTFDMSVDFVSSGTAQPLNSTTVSVGGHTLNRIAYSTPDQCKYTSTQGKTQGGYETVSVYVQDSSGSPSAQLCDNTATVTARFLDAAGLT